MYTSGLKIVSWQYNLPISFGDGYKVVMVVVVTCAVVIVVVVTTTGVTLVVVTLVVVNWKVVVTFEHSFETSVKDTEGVGTNVSLAVK